MYLLEINLQQSKRFHDASMMANKMLCFFEQLEMESQQQQLG
jgi:hypothetical protein